MTKGRHVNKDGYVFVRNVNHPRAHRGYVLEHIVVAEKMLKRRLREGETVHHLNGLRWDNRPENLEIWSGNHPSGVREEDLLAWAVDFVIAKAPHLLR